MSRSVSLLLKWKKSEKVLVYNGKVMSFRCFKNKWGFYLSLKKYVSYGFDFKPKILITLLSDHKNTVSHKNI